MARQTQFIWFSMVLACYRKFQIAFIWFFPQNMLFIWFSMARPLKYGFIWFSMVCGHPAQGDRNPPGVENMVLYGL